MQWIDTTIYVLAALIAVLAVILLVSSMFAHEQVRGSTVGAAVAGILVLALALNIEPIAAGIMSVPDYLASITFGHILAVLILVAVLSVMFSFVRFVGGLAGDDSGRALAAKGLSVGGTVAIVLVLIAIFWAYASILA